VTEGASVGPGPHDGPTLALTFASVGPEGAALVAELKRLASRDLTVRFGRGHWSGEATEHGVVAGLRQSQVWVARHDARDVATFRLSARKPWAIDAAYFGAAERPLYLTDMAVAPDAQRCGVGRRCLAEAVRIAGTWPADALRLDAYDAPAGAGPFYARCGFREVARVSYRGVPLVFYEQPVAAPHDAAAADA
jgi:GNAT superfamily N-acetyltransferase